MALRAQLPDVINPPDDVCIKVFVPNDPGYILALRSAITLLSHWYSWERDSQHLGKEAARRWTQADLKTVNALISGETCDDCEEASGGETVIYMGQGSSGEEEDMGQSVTEVFIRDGKLVVRYGHCCEEVFDFPGADEDIPDDPIDDVVGPGLPFTQYSACAKSDAMVDLTLEVGQAIWDARWMPWRWVKNAQNAAGYDLVDAAILLAGSAATNLAMIEAIKDTDIFDTVKWQKIRCALETRMAADGHGITTDDYEFFRARITSEFFALDSYGLIAPFWMYIASAIAWHNYNKHTKLAAVNTDVDCTCPGGTGGPYDYDYTWDFEVEQDNWTIEDGDGWAVGEGLRGNDNWGNGSSGTYLRASGDSREAGLRSGIIKIVELEYTHTLGNNVLGGAGLYLRIGGVDQAALVDEVAVRAGGGNIALSLNEVWTVSNPADAVTLKFSFGEEQNGSDRFLLKRLRIAGTGDAPIEAPLP